MAILRKTSLYHLASLSSLGFILFPDAATASNFQDFSGINYSNPAELTLLVKNTQLIIGDEYFSPSPHLTFNGTVTVPDPSGQGNNVSDTGSTSNTDHVFLPYGRIAKRLSPQWVIGLDVSKPFSSDIIYPNNSAVRYSVTSSQMDSVDVAPNIAYQFSGALSNLSVGVGLDAMYYNISLDSMYPSLPTQTAPFGSGSDLSFANQASNWAYGWHAGLLYHLFRGTFVGLSYFSAINQNFTGGTSTFTGFTPSNTFATTIPLPATTNFSILQFLSQKWSVLFKVHYSQWNTLQQMTLSNIAGPSPTSSALMYFHYKNTWRFDLGTHYDLTPKLTLGALLAYDETPTNDTDRTLALPGADQFIAGISAEYKFTKAVAVQASYGHVFAINVPLNNVDPNTGIATTGTANIFGNIIGLQLSVNT